MSFVVVPASLGYPLTFSYGIKNTMKLLGRDFDYCHEVAILANPATTSRFENELAKYQEPDHDKIKGEIAMLWNRFGMPVKGDRGFFEMLSPGSSNVSCLFDPGECQWGWRNYEKMVHVLAEETPIRNLMVSSFAIPGFKRSPETLTQDVRLLREHVVTNSCYERFDIRFNVMKGMSWRDREKRRKRLKEPELQELGTLRFCEGGGIAVKIVIQKDGYEFLLDFSDTESLEAFTGSKWFEMTKWSINE